jgi:hypothetical protein
MIWHVNDARFLDCEGVFGIVSGTAPLEMAFAFGVFDGRPRRVVCGERFC